jgi:hypothetical protein
LFIGSNLTLGQLKRDGYVGGHVNRLTISGCGPEADLFRDATRFFIKTVAQAMHYALDQNLS